MPEYNIRVRATDNSGAFADRDFSLNVRDTQTEQFVAVNGTNIFSSPDGFNWTTRASVGSTLALSTDYGWAPVVVHGGGLWMIFAGGNAANSTNFTYYTSTNGVNWVTRTFPSPSLNNIRTTPFYVNGRWVIVARNTNAGTNPLFESVNGIDWSLTANAPFLNVDFANIYYADGLYVVANAGASTFPGIVWTSPDLSTWTRIQYSSFISAQWATPLFVNDMWYFIDRNTLDASNRIAITPELSAGVIPTLIPVSGAALPAQARHFQLCYGNGRMVLTQGKLSNTAVGSVSTVWTSDDLGRSWISRTIPSLGNTTAASNVYQVFCTFYAGYFWLYAVGDTPTNTIPVRISRDGITWETPTMTGLPNGRLTGFGRRSFN